MNPFVRNQLKLLWLSAIELVVRTAARFFVATKKATGRLLRRMRINIRRMTVNIKKAIGSLFASAVLYTRRKWKKNAKRVIEVVVYFIIIPIMLFIFFVNMEVSVKELPFVKIAIILGSLVAIGLLLWLGWSKRTSMASALRGTSSTSGAVSVRGVALSVFTPLAVFFLFNLAFWAMLKQIHGDWGSEYFAGTWLWSPAFIVLAMATIVMALSYGKADKRFGWLKVPAAAMIGITVLFAMIPGIWGPQKPKVPTGAEASAVNYVLPRKLTDVPWIVFQGPDKDSVIAAFPGDTTMWNIAGAESNFRQFNAGGSPLLNAEGSSAVGVFQIMESLHGRDCGTSDSLDIYTLSGNIACARILRLRNGYKDWAESAWKWRDRYSEKPEGWQYDRTPEQFVAGVIANNDEVVVVDVPVGSVSVRVESRGRQYCIPSSSNIPYIIIDDVGKRDTVFPGLEAPKLTRYARWLQFESIGEPQRIVYTRRPPGVVGCSTA